MKGCLRIVPSPVHGTSQRTRSNSSVSPLHGREEHGIEVGDERAHAVDPGDLVCQQIRTFPLQLVCDDEACRQLPATAVRIVHHLEELRCFRSWCCTQVED